MAGNWGAGQDHCRNWCSDRETWNRGDIEHHRLDDGLTRYRILQESVWVRDYRLGDRRWQGTRSEWIRGTEVVFGKAVQCSRRRDIGPDRERYGVGCRKRRRRAGNL